MHNCALLHVEDDDAAAFLFRMALDEAEIQTSVYRVSDGQSAMDFLRKAGAYRHARSPDLIVLDLNLPRLDGWTVLAELRKMEEFRSTPVVIGSSAPAFHNARKAHLAGAQRYVQKGFDFHSFVAEVKQCCAVYLSREQTPAGLWTEV